MLKTILLSLQHRSNQHDDTLLCSLATYNYKYKQNVLRIHCGINVVNRRRRASPYQGFLFCYFFGERSHLLLIFSFFFCSLSRSLSLVRAPFGQSTKYKKKVIIQWKKKKQCHMCRRYLIVSAHVLMSILSIHILYTFFKWPSYFAFRVFPVVHNDDSLSSLTVFKSTKLFTTTRSMWVLFLICLIFFFLLILDLYCVCVVVDNDDINTLLDEKADDAKANKAPKVSALYVSQCIGVDVLFIYIWSISPSKTHFICTYSILCVGNNFGVGFVIVCHNRGCFS